MPAFKDLKIMPLDIDQALADQPKLLEWWQQVTGVK